MAKKQHYVPQLLLRNWSQDGRSINIFLMPGKIIPQAPISSQAQEHYYYGPDQKIENIYGEMENRFSIVLKNKIFLENMSFSKEERASILFFIASQKS